MEKLELYYIDLKYIRDLSRVDDNVMSISPQRGKDNRPFVGVVILLNGLGYCIPLTSPKDKFKTKKSQVDFIKIFDEKKSDTDGQYKLIGVLNINNMIPVDATVIQKVDLTVHKNDSLKTRNNKALMQKQIAWCRTHSEVIQNRAQKVYDYVTKYPEKNINLVRRSSKFEKLESILRIRNEKKGTPLIYNNHTTD